MYHPVVFQVLIATNSMSALSQMPVVLIPIHFDRDSVNRNPSFQHSVVLRPFVTQDFMTGVPAIPGKHLPLEASTIHYFSSLYTCILPTPLCMYVCNLKQILKFHFSPFTGCRKDGFGNSRSLWCFKSNV